MKDIAVKGMSVILALACIFAVFGCVGSIKDVLKAKEYWEGVNEEALESFGMLRDGIDQLSENQKAYTEGVDAYEEGQKAYEEGKKTVEEGEKKLEAGQKEYDVGEAKLIAGHKEYDDGVAQLAAGKAQVAQGERDLAAGKAKLEQGRAELAAGKAAYAEGQAAYNDNAAKLADAEAQLESRRADYEAGKAKLELVTPIYMLCKPLAENAAAARGRYDEAVAAGEESPVLELLRREVEAQEALLNVSLAGYSMSGIVAEYEDGLAQIQLFEESEALINENKVKLADAGAQLQAAADKIAAGEAEVAAGEAQVAQGEADLAAGRQEVAAGEAKLAAAKKLLDENDKKLADAKAELENGKKDLADGKQELENGAKDLAEGLKQLNLYEGGEMELADGLDLAISTPPYCDGSGEPIVPGIRDRLGEDFTYWTVNEKGKLVLMNGAPFINLDNANKVYDAGMDFLSDTSDMVTKELTGRVIVAAIAALAAVAGVLAAALAFFGVLKISVIPGVTSAAAGLVGLAVTLVSGSDLPYSTIAEAVRSLPGPVYLGALTAAALVHCTLSFMAKAAQKAEKV